MEAWRREVEEAVRAFLCVAELGGAPLSNDEIQIEYLVAPHRPPSGIPSGKMAVYGFWGDGCWLKIGKVGPNSHARYSAQHYSAGSAQSTLAGSLLRCDTMAQNDAFDRSNPGIWIKNNANRVNILLDASLPRELLSLLESFLHLRLRPRYEG